MNPSDGHIEEEERVVTELLRTRLPRYPASDALKERLAAQVAGGAKLRAEPPKPSRSWSIAGPLLAAALAAAGVMLFIRANHAPDSGPARDSILVTEAVNDHLRVLYAEHPIEIESGGIHQVKPWFSGRLDFAPSVAFDGDADFSLEGGAVGYFIDRKAATFVFKRRLHTISVFVFRAEGLPWPASGAQPAGPGHPEVTTRRGFHVVLFRTEELGYALVSDVDAAELVRLGAKIADTH